MDPIDNSILSKLGEGNINAETSTPFAEFDFSMDKLGFSIGNDHVRFTYRAPILNDILLEMELPLSPSKATSGVNAGHTVRQSFSLDAQCQKKKLERENRIPDYNNREITDYFSPPQKRFDGDRQLPR